MLQLPRLPQHRKSQGFTLLELLVVISIIGILVSIGFAAFTTAQKKARDARRRGDVKAMADAIELYYADNSSSYAGACPAAFTGSLMTLADPKTGGSYGCYVFSADEFTVAAELETADGNCSCPDSSNCNYVYNSGTHFCMSNRQ